MKVYFLSGLPASGKTTWAKERLAENPNGIKRISKDDLRAMLDGGRWSGDMEKFVLKARDALISLALDEKKARHSRRHQPSPETRAAHRGTREGKSFGRVS